MIALQVEGLREFTQHLFVRDTFDAFWLSEADIRTKADLIIQGRIDPGFFASNDTDAGPADTSGHSEENGAPAYLTWGEVRHYCYEWIKGPVLPLSFRVLLRDPERTEDEAYLNIRYERDKALFITTGYAQKTFSMDRTDEREWDDEVRTFLAAHDIGLKE